MASESIDLTPYLKWIGLGLVVFVGGMIALAITLGTATEESVTGPGEAYNRTAVDRLVTELGSGRTPERLESTATTADALVRLREATSREAAYSYGAFTDASHGLSCFDYVTKGPRGEEHVLVTVDSEHGPPAVTAVVLKGDCKCRRTGRLYCSR